MMTAISRDKLQNLIKAGVLRAKRVDERTVLIELDSFLQYLDSLPDVGAEEARHGEVTLESAMKSYRAEQRKAHDLFSEPSNMSWPQVTTGGEK
jgi:hypothetical protein